MENRILCSAVIVAGGNGSRMNRKEKKQFLMIGDSPILVHTVKNISKSDLITEIIVVAPKEETDETKKMLKDLKKVKKVVSGGKTRAESVKCGIDEVSDCDIILIHDGVRPFIKKDTAENCIKDAQKYGGAVLGVCVKDTVVIKDSDENIDTVLKRKSLIAVQTPQCFRAELIRKAYSDFDESLTDDASQVKRIGGTVHITEGDFSNIKITVPEDLITAENMIKTNG